VNRFAPFVKEKRIQMRLLMLFDVFRWSHSRLSETPPKMGIEDEVKRHRKAMGERARIVLIYPGHHPLDALANSIDVLSPAKPTLLDRQ